MHSDFGEVRKTSSLVASVLWILGMTSSHASRHCSQNAHSMNNCGAKLTATLLTHKITYTNYSHCKRKESFILHILKFNRGCTTSKFKKFWFNHPSFYHHTTVLRPFLGPPGWAGARKELLDFMVQGKIYRNRRTDSPDGHHSIRTKQCPPPPSPIFLQAGCPSCHQPIVSKHWRQLAHSD